MNRTLPIVSMISILIGVLGAVLLTLDGFGLLLFVPFTLALGILMVMRKTPIMYAGGAVALIAAIIGILGMFENVGTDSGTLDLGVDAAAARAASIIGFVVASAAILAQNWGKTEPAYLDYLGIVGIVGSAIMVAFTSNDLGNPSNTINFLTGVFLILAIVPPFVAFREAE